MEAVHDFEGTGLTTVPEPMRKRNTSRPSLSVRLLLKDLASYVLAAIMED